MADGVKIKQHTLRVEFILPENTPAAGPFSSSTPTTPIDPGSSMEASETLLVALALSSPPQPQHRVEESKTTSKPLANEPSLLLSCVEAEPGQVPETKAAAGATEIDSDAPKIPAMTLSQIKASQLAQRELQTGNGPPEAPKGVVAQASSPPDLFTQKEPSSVAGTGPAAVPPPCIAPVPPVSNSPIKSPIQPPTSALQIPRNQIEVRSPLGSGGSAIVFRADWRGSPIAFKVRFPPLLFSDHPRRIDGP
jgi:hypothetical protein